jgi:hypothetical protein
VRAALQGFLALKGRIRLETKLVVTVGDLAYLSNTWSLSGTGPDGNRVVLGATTAEVARRQADGTWRYVIDNAWGDQAVGGSPSTATTDRVASGVRARSPGWVSVPGVEPHQPIPPRPGVPVVACLTCMVFTRQGCWDVRVDAHRR